MTHEQYQRAAAFWTDLDSKGVKAPQEIVEKRADEFLRSHNTCALATACEGMVRCTPIEYVWYDRHIWIYSEGGLKFNALERNKAVALAIFDPFAGFASTHGMQISGTADIIDEESACYEEMLALKHLSKERLSKLGHPMHLICITPSCIDLLLSEFKKEGYSARQALQFGE